VTALRVAEVFGPTAQGEGPHTGHVSAFVRLSGCNLSCSWCDTPYTWDWTRFSVTDESTLRTPSEIAGQVNAMAVERCVLTGGEPLVQQRRLPDLLRRLRVPVDVETNGTIAPSPELVDAVSLFVVSPKIMPSAEQHLDLADRTGALDTFRALGGRQVALKYVARDAADLVAVQEHVRLHKLGSLPVYVMPEARTAEQLVQRTAELADLVVAAGFRLGTRLHVLAWGDARAH
jgi:organic radical activating enzyme